MRGLCDCISYRGGCPFDCRALEKTELVCVPVGITVLGDGVFRGHDVERDRLCVLFECWSVSADACVELSGEHPGVCRTLSVVPELCGLSATVLVGGMDVLGGRISCVDWKCCAGELADRDAISLAPSGYVG